MTRVTVGVSLKTYFARQRARDWFSAAAEHVRARLVVLDGAVEVFVVPTYLQLADALAAFAGTPVRVGAQDVSAYPPGAFTGEISAAELAESGVRIAEIGHAERRRLFGETDDVVAAKATAALGAGLTPVLCLGEDERLPPDDAARLTVAQLERDLVGAPSGAVIIAYEPIWAIGAAEPAGADHILAVTRALRAALAADPARAGSSVVYGGSAGPGLLDRIGDGADGLFLGRFAHDAGAFAAVLDEAVQHASRKSAAAS